MELDIERLLLKRKKTYSKEWQKARNEEDLERCELVENNAKMVINMAICVQSWEPKKGRMGFVIFP